MAVRLHGKPDFAAGLLPSQLLRKGLSFVRREDCQGGSLLLVPGEMEVGRAGQTKVLVDTV